MAEERVFHNVTVHILANIYFDGAVQSRTIVLSDGTRKTLGVYLPGEYTFDSDVAEIVEITKGEVEVLLPGDERWKKFTVGEVYKVPSNCTFRVRCSSITEYICDYL